jgi:predicted nucleotidyltransferase
MLTNQDIRDFAVKIALMLLRGARKIGRTVMAEQNLFAGLSMRVALGNEDFNAINPAISEVLLFGSTARKEETPWDLDLIILDSGFYSGVLLLDLVGVHRQGAYRAGALKNQLRELLTMWFEVPENGEEMQIIEDGPEVDLHVLPVKILHDRRVWEDVAKLHTDPRFLENAFSRIERFDNVNGTFVPTTLRELREKHRPVVA